jgi:hypothetical protein
MAHFFVNDGRNKVTRPSADESEPVTAENYANILYDGKPLHELEVLLVAALREEDPDPDYILDPFVGIAHRFNDWKDDMLFLFGTPGAYMAIIFSLRGEEIDGTLTMETLPERIVYRHATR